MKDILIVGDKFASIEGEIILPEDTVKVITSNPATALKLNRKGRSNR